MTADGWDELLKEAQGRLTEQEAEEAEASAELGESVDLDEQESFVGRFRGHGIAYAKRDGKSTPVDVYLLWDIDGAKRFMWPKTILQQQFDEVQPNIGDRIVIVRGHDKPVTDPNKNPMQRFAARAERCDDPLPDDDEIPF